MQTLAPDLLGLQIAKENRFADQFIRHRQTRLAGVIHAVEQVEALDRPVLTVIVMPTDQVILIRMRLFLDRIIYKEYAIGLLDGAHQRLDLLPQRLAIIVSRRQKARDLIMAGPPRPPEPTSPWPWSHQTN